MIPLMEILEVVTIGFPFCAFKIICGLFFLREESLWIAAPVLFIGLVDTFINSLNLASLLLKKKRVTNACLFSLKTVSGSNEEDFRNSIDVLFSFILVAYMVGFGKLGGLPGIQLPVWNLSVVLNVLGAGINRLSHTYRNLPKR
jgi:hypothetical protein